MFAIDYQIKNKNPTEYLYRSTDKDKNFLSKSNIFEYSSIKTKYAIDRLPVYHKNINYIFQNIHIGDIPENLLYLLPNIEKSKSILSFEDDWDDEESHKYDIHTWIVTIRFLLNYSKVLYQDFNIEIDTPKIYPGPKGSIEILWEENNYKLLINIEKKGEDALFYADNQSNSQVTEGHFKVNNFKMSLLPIAIQF